MKVARALTLALIAPLGMGVLGSAAMMTDIIEEATHDVSALLTAVFFLPFSFVIGCVVGLPTILIVVPCLLCKRLLPALMFVYGPSLILVVADASRRKMWQDAETTKLIAMASVCAFSVVGVLVLPRQSFSTQGRCPKCDYPIGVNPVCTECGGPVTSSTATKSRNPAS